LAAAWTKQSSHMTTKQTEHTVTKSVKSITRTYLGGKSILVSRYESRHIELEAFTEAADSKQGSVVVIHQSIDQFGGRPESS